MMRTGFALAAAAVGMALGVSGQASAKEPMQLQACGVGTPAATQWMTRNAWRYTDSVQAEAAYQRLLSGQSPWPDWYNPEVSVLMPGTRFQMALSSTQPSTSPGGFGTFDYIDSVEQVRKYLAVLPNWKADVAKMVTYEVKAPMLVSVGPIGPQVDQETCALYTGEFTQIQFLVPPADRMDYLKVVGERPIQ